MHGMRSRTQLSSPARRRYRLHARPGCPALPAQYGCL